MEEIKLVVVEKFDFESLHVIIDKILAISAGDESGGKDIRNKGAVVGLGE